MNMSDIKKINTKQVFFGEKGLTSSSANFIANKAKEIVENLKLNKLSFVTTHIRAVQNGDSAPTLLSQGVKGIMGIKEDLNTIAKLHALEAWLREAIKAKNELAENVSELKYEDYSRETGVEQPKITEAIYSVNDDDWLNTLSEHEHAEYLKAQAFAAVFGKAVHPSGVIARARVELQSIENEPNKMISTDKADYIYNYTASIGEEEVENFYFDLQDTQREWQARFNKFEFDKEEWLREKKNEEDLKTKEVINEYQAKMQKFAADFRVWQSNLKNEVKELKIVIPNSLKEIYETVRSR